MLKSVSLLKRVLRSLIPCHGPVAHTMPHLMQSSYISALPGSLRLILFSPQQFPRSADNCFNWHVNEACRLRKATLGPAPLSRSLKYYQLHRNSFCDEQYSCSVQAVRLAWGMPCIEIYNLFHKLMCSDIKYPKEEKQFLIAARSVTMIYMSRIQIYERNMRPVMSGYMNYNVTHNSVFLCVHV